MNVPTCLPTARRRQEGQLKIAQRFNAGIAATRSIKSRRDERSWPTVLRALGRSADFQSAVSPNCIRQSVGSVPRAGISQRLAEYNSALRCGAEHPRNGGLLSVVPAGQIVIEFPKGVNPNPCSESFRETFEVPPGFGLRQSSGAFPTAPREPKAAEGCRSPRHCRAQRSALDAGIAGASQGTGAPSSDPARSTRGPTHRVGNRRSVAIHTHRLILAMQTEFKAKTQRREGASRFNCADGHGSVMRKRGFNSSPVEPAFLASLRLCAVALKCDPNRSNDCVFERGCAALDQPLQRAGDLR